MNWSKATLAQLPWEAVDGYPGVKWRFLGESQEDGPWIMHIQHSPGYVEKKHWHEADTVYVFTDGEMVVDGEGTYRPGDVRWVRAGTYYGPETAGPDGCEFLLISYGLAAMHYEAPSSS